MRVPTTLDETINGQFVSTVSSVVADTLNDKIAEAEQNLGAAQNNSVAQLSRAVDFGFRCALEGKRVGYLHRGGPPEGAIGERPA